MDPSENAVYSSFPLVVVSRFLAVAYLLIEPLSRNGQCLSNNVTVFTICSTHEGGETCIQKVLVGKREAKGTIGTSGRRWKIGMDV
jgi:hypothetical protein